MKEGTVVSTRHIFVEHSNSNNPDNVTPYKEFGSREEMKSWVDMNTVVPCRENLSGMKFYAAYTRTETYHKESNVVDRDSLWGCCFVLKEDLKKAGFGVLKNNRLPESLLETFKVPMIREGRDTYWVKIDAYKKLYAEISKPHKAYVLEGTDWPYWFILGETKLPSRTSNWPKYLLGHGVIPKNFLVPYEGEDKSGEHKNDPLPEEACCDVQS